MELVSEATFKKEKAEVVEKLGLDESDISDVADLKAQKKILAKREEERNSRKSAPSGSLPMNTTSGGVPNRNSDGSYENFAEMLKDVHRMENSSNPEEREKGKEIMNELWKKWIEKAKKDKALPDVSNQNPFASRSQKSWTER